MKQRNIRGRKSGRQKTRLQRWGRFLRERVFRRAHAKGSERDAYLEHQTLGFLDSIMPYDKRKNYDKRKHFFLNFITVMEHLTRKLEPKRINTPFDKLLPQVLKANGIRNIAEVGPGANPLLLILAGPLKKAGCSLRLIGPVSALPELADKSGIELTPTRAGKLPKGVAENQDLIIANNVFDVGGSHIDPLTMEEIEKTIQRNPKAVLQLVEKLSDNPNARVILTESESVPSEVLLLDKNLVQENARIVKWERMNGPKTRITKGTKSPYFLPDVVVLAKKQEK